MRRVRPNTFLTYGAPSLFVTIVGSIFLARFVKGRNEVADRHSASYSNREFEEEYRRRHQEEWRQQNERPFDLEAAYKEMRNKMNLDEWKAVPIQRSDEEQQLEEDLLKKLKATASEGGRGSPSPPPAQHQE